MICIHSLLRQSTSKLYHFLPLSFFSNLRFTLFARSL
jgi:hypothetical protein